LQCPYDLDDKKERSKKIMSIQKSTDSSSLAEVIDRILDKGIVIDAFARVSLVGIEILTVEARVVIASVDTWLRYAEAVGLLRDEIQEKGFANQQNERNTQFSF
jgi:gas vesicle structural protein